jgi:hypothetical protein
MEKNSLQEVQKYTSTFYIGLLNGGMIKMNCIQSEDMSESADGSIYIILKSATYNDRLYNAFRNKELISYIRKETTTRNIETLEDIEHSYDYNRYFKINNFSSENNNDSCGSFGFEFISI